MGRHEQQSTYMTGHLQTGRRRCVSEQRATKEHTIVPLILVAVRRLHPLMAAVAEC